jgi:hypothetical protein
MTTVTSTLTMIILVIVQSHHFGEALSEQAALVTRPGQKLAAQV